LAALLAIAAKDWFNILIELNIQLAIYRLLIPCLFLIINIRDNMDYAGIIANINWNSNGWKAPAKAQDINRSNHRNVKFKKDVPHEDLNFAIDDYPKDFDDYHLGYVAKFQTNILHADKVRIVFFISTKAPRERYIVGFYGYPIFSHKEWFKRENGNYLNDYLYGNIKAKIETFA
jgi:hypothetical protein